MVPRWSRRDIPLAKLLAFLLDPPPRRRICRDHQIRGELEQRLVAPRERHRIAVREQDDREHDRRVGADRQHRRIGPERRGARLELVEGRVGLAGLGQVRQRVGEVAERGREVGRGLAEADDQLAVEVARVALQTVGHDQLAAVRQAHDVPGVADLGVLAGATGQRLLDAEHALGEAEQLPGDPAADVILASSAA
jgi:hypothetical protein